MNRINEFLKDIAAVFRRHWMMKTGVPAETQRYYCDIATAGYVFAKSEDEAKRMAATILISNLATGFASFTAYVDEDSTDGEVPPDEMLGFNDQPIVIDSTAAPV